MTFKFPRKTALVHDKYAVAYAEYLGQVRRYDDDADPVVNELINNIINLDLRAYVYAARRLVEDEDLRRGHEPFAEHDLLLIAAGEVPGLLLDRRRLYAAALSYTLGAPYLLVIIHDAELRDIFLRLASDMFLLISSSRTKSVTLTVFGGEAYAGGYGGAGIFRVYLFAVYEYLSGCLASPEMEETHDQLCAACADEACHAEHLALYIRRNSHRPLSY